MKPNITFLLLLSTLLLNCTQISAQIDVKTSFMVFSDPHYYDPSLGTEGAAFQNYLDQDRKLLRESRELLIQAIQICSASEADFILIPGDLTKDGTLISHQEFAKLLQRLEELGKPVYVVPGNHDILNGESNSFKGDEKILVQNISPEKFRENYNQFGYAEAINSDPNSHSYVVEPVDGLWVLGLDACLYRNNLPEHHPLTDGAFKEETLQWIEEIAKEANSQNKRMIAFMHHGILEHYKGQEKFYGEYVVDDFKKVSEKFASLGINIVFTGHYHAQDITIRTWKNGNYLLDIETGSLVTYPCPIREVKIENEVMHIKSFFIQETEKYSEGFTEYSKEYVHSGISGIAENTLISYRLKPEDATKLSGQIADAFVAHYQGDELAGTRLDLKGVRLMGRLIISFKKKLISSLYTDLPPGDNDLTIDLSTGKTIEFQKAE